MQEFNYLIDTKANTLEYEELFRQISSYEINNSISIEETIRLTQCDSK